jgi:hypothetical protein
MEDDDGKNANIRKGIASVDLQQQPLIWNKLVSLSKRGMPSGYTGT